MYFFAGISPRYSRMSNNKRAAVLSLQLRTITLFLGKKIMAVGGYKISDQGGMHFVSFAVIGCLPD